MATKTKAKSKAPKKAPKRHVREAKSPRLSRKPPKLSRKPPKLSRKPPKKSASKSRTKPSAKVKSRRASVAAATTSAPTTTRIRSKQFASAVHAYEAGLKAVHGEDFEKAKKILENLIAGYPDEPENQERAKVLVT